MGAVGNPVQAVVARPPGLEEGEGLSDQKGVRMVCKKSLGSRLGTRKGAIGCRPPKAFKEDQDGGMTGVVVA